jgi:GNAT superfamily N-acetyltransferase
MNVFQQVKQLFGPRANGRPAFLNRTVEPCSIELDTGGPEGDLLRIRQSVYAENRSRSGISDYAPLNLTLRDARSTTVGGLIGSSHWGWLHVELLWVDESVRRRGFGRQLLLTAENVARKRKCRHACLETFSLQDALPFYTSLGYVQFAVLEDFPIGHRKYFLRKDLHT